MDAGAFGKRRFGLILGKILYRVECLQHVQGIDRIRLLLSLQQSIENRGQDANLLGWCLLFGRALLLFVVFALDVFLVVKHVLVGFLVVFDFLVNLRRDEEQAVNLELFTFFLLPNVPVYRGLLGFPHYIGLNCHGNLTCSNHLRQEFFHTITHHCLVAREALHYLQNHNWVFQPRKELEGGMRDLWVTQIALAEPLFNIIFQIVFLEVIQDPYLTLLVWEKVHVAVACV